MLGFGSGFLEDATAYCGLAGCLAGDAQCVTDLGPTRAFAPCSVGHEKSCATDRLMGVSQGSQVVQRALRASLDGAEGVDGSAGFPASLRALVGAHPAHRKPKFRLRWRDCAGAAVNISCAFPSICDTPFSEWRPVGAPNGGLGRIGSCMSAPTQEMGGSITANEWPRATAIAGAVDGIRWF